MRFGLTTTVSGTQKARYEYKIEQSAINVDQMATNRYLLIENLLFCDTLITHALCVCTV